MASAGSFLLLLTSLMTVCYASNKNIIVNSPFGQIKGEFTPGINGDQGLVVFRNIPYAKPPVGELRFAKPQPHPPLGGIFDATDKRPIACIHPDAMRTGQDENTEDCLILNIFSKGINEPGQGRKKVMVFIHGGAFLLGTSHYYDLTSFVTTHDVIGVTINYRMGILGFLSTGNEAGPGNYGLWDQTLALRWIKDNIEAFGGDPEDITIVGESAGAFSVTYQSISPLTKGLFSKVCAQSGTASGVFGTAIDVQKHALMIAKHAKCWEGEVTDKLDAKQSETLHACLRKADVSVFSSFFAFPVAEANFVPRVDGDFVPRKPLLLLQDESYLESIGFYDRSYLVSLVNNEFAIIRSSIDMIHQAIQSNAYLQEEEKKGAILKMGMDIKEYYLKSRLNADALPSPLADNIMDFYARRNIEDDVVLDLVNDLTMIIPSYDFLNAASKQKKCKSWFLFFDHFPAFMKGRSRGMIHGLDLLYWFDFGVQELENLMMHAGMQGEMDDEDVTLKSMFSGVIADFVKYGDPGVSLKEDLPSGWPVYDVTNSNYLNFNLQPTVRSHLEREKRDLWLKSVPKETKETHEHSEL